LSAMIRFKTGKIPSSILISKVFRYKGRRDPAVILGASIGEDAALISYCNEVLVLKTDPVTGTSSDLGWLSVHINANDVACRGAKPKWYLCDLLLPERSDAALVQTIMRDVDRAAKQVDVAVVGGHTEVTPGLKRPIVIGYMVGLTGKNEFITSSGACPGDHIVLTKAIGIEGTAVLASDFLRELRGRLNNRKLTRARRLMRKISVVNDALLAARVGGVHAMHDPTEGGLLQGIWELAEASKIGFLIHESRIPMHQETREICSILKVDPLRLMSSGCLLIAADRKRSGRIVERLEKHGIRACIIGTFTPRRKGRKLIRVNSEVEEIGPSERDELYKVLEKRHVPLA
jgi:hydrogenase expression/formation protein HypE